MSGVHRGRKYKALLITIPLIVLLVAAMVFLAYKGKSVPLALGGALIAFSSCWPGYLGVNAYQKKVQAEHPAMQEDS